MNFVLFHDSLLTMSGHFSIHCSCSVQRVTAALFSGLDRLEGVVFSIHIAHVKNAWSHFSTLLFCLRRYKCLPVTCRISAEGE
jgi:hypothetical protein